MKLRTYTSAGKIETAPILPLAADGAAPVGVTADPEGKGEKEKVEEKTFLQKYWYYIVPVVVMMILPSGDPNDGMA